jgi:hypothetical protein
MKKGNCVNNRKKQDDNYVQTFYADSATGDGAEFFSGVPDIIGCIQNFINHVINGRNKTG